VGAYKRLRWKQALNEYRFIKEEHEIVQSLGREAAPLFQHHYEDFLQRHNIDLTELNQQNADRIQEAYNLPELEWGDVPAPPEDNECTEITPNPSDPQEKSEEQQLTEDEQIIHQIFTKLFKQIAVKVHPDKINVYDYDFHQREQMTKDFREANAALKNRNYFVLLDMAERLGIPLPKNYEQQTRWMKKEIQKARDELAAQKRTYNYLFAAADTDAERDNVIRQFVRQLFGLNLS